MDVYVYCSVEAVHRYYESRKRIFNDNQPHRLEAAQTAKRTSRRRALQKQVCALSACRIFGTNIFKQLHFADVVNI